jgi:hypothetical protein
MDRIKAIEKKRPKKGLTMRRVSSPESSERPQGRRPRGVAKQRQEKPAPVQQMTTIPVEHIRVRAYYLSLERNGCADPLVDWLRAESELTGSRSKA